MSYSYDRRAATDPKKLLVKIVHDAEKDLKEFLASLPPEAEPYGRVNTNFESPPPRGGYGPYETGSISFLAGLKGGGRPVDVEFSASVVVNLTDGVVGIGAKSRNHTLEGLLSQGTIKDAPARLKKVLTFFKESLATEARRIQQQTKVQTKEPESEEAWSVVTLGKGHSYATEVDVFTSKSKAEQEAKDRGDCYVVKGTQMWNEPLGQVEEHDRNVPSKFFP
jgi:hypothetical protein